MRYVTIAVPISAAKYGGLFFHASKRDLLTALYKAISDYVSCPEDKTKDKVNKIIETNWDRIPKECKSSGRAFRVWIFTPKDTQEVLRRFATKSYFTARPTNFLSFTENEPTNPEVFKKLKSVFELADPKPGSLILIQEHEYKRGFLVTDFFKYLFDQEHLLEEDEVNLEDFNCYHDQLSEVDIRLMNNEQEIFVFDPNLKIGQENIVAIKVVVPKNFDYKESFKIKGFKFVDCTDINDARDILSEV